MHLGVSLLLVGASELSAASVAAERLFAGVRSDVSREVVGAREASHADAALERLLASVDANVARELIRAGEAAIAVLDGACIRSLVHRRLARAIRVLARFHRDELQRHRALLVDLRENLVALARCLVVLG